MGPLDPFLGTMVETCSCLLGSEGHGQIWGGLVTVSCGSVFSGSTWSLRRHTGQCLQGGEGPWDPVWGGHLVSEGRQSQDSGRLWEASSPRISTRSLCLSFLLWSISWTIVGLPQGCASWHWLSALVNKARDHTAEPWARQGPLPVCPWISLMVLLSS